MSEREDVEGHDRGLCFDIRHPRHRRAFMRELARIKGNLEQGLKARLVVPVDV